MGNWKDRKSCSSSRRSQGGGLEITQELIGHFEQIGSGTTSEGV